MQIILVIQSNFLILLEEKDIILEELSFNLGGEIYSCGNSCGSCQILQEKELKTYYFNENKKEASIFLNGCLIEKKKVMKC